MKLTRSEYLDFLGAHLRLLYYVGRQRNLFDPMTFEDFLNLEMKIKFKCRRAVIEDSRLLDRYLEDNRKELSNVDLEILNGFRKQKSGQFIIYKCLSKFAIFVDTSDNSFYAVNALGDRFDEFFDKFPILVTTCILPFRDKIIYDGFMEPVSYVGSSLTESLRDDYEMAKTENKIRHSWRDEQTSY